MTSLSRIPRIATTPRSTAARGASVWGRGKSIGPYVDPYGLHPPSGRAPRLTSKKDSDRHTMQEIYSRYSPDACCASARNASAVSPGGSGYGLPQGRPVHKECSRRRIAARSPEYTSSQAPPIAPAYQSDISVPDAGEFLRAKVWRRMGP